MAQAEVEHGELLRVEELARAGAVSVDTVRFYQKRRLLPSPVRDGRIAWYGPEHVERLARIRELQARGFSLAVIRRLLDGELEAADEPLVAAVSDALAGTDADDPTAGLLSLDELARRTEVPVELLETVVAEGLLVPQHRDGRDWYAPGDVDIVRAGLTLLDAGVPLDELLALSRDQHRMTRAVAEQAVALFDAHVREPLLHGGLTEDETARRLVESFRMLLPAVTTLVAQHFRSVLLEVAQERFEQ